MELKNKKQELSDMLAKLTAAGSYDELIFLSQKVMILAVELKISEQLEVQIDAKVKDAVAAEVGRVTVRVEKAVEVFAKDTEPTIEVVSARGRLEESVVQTAAAPAVRAASISEKLQTADVSIAARLSKSSIKDLTKAVSINQKILFTKELFKGDSFAFNEAIGKLNAFENKDEAIGFLQNDLRPKFSFRAEAESYAQFVELIERRYV
jgi:vancomycin resistance protein YoaR